MKEKTLIILKPDCLERSLVGQVLSEFESRALIIEGARLLYFDSRLIEEHYCHLIKKEFFPMLSKFMTRGPCLAFIISGENAVERCRLILGATNPLEADAGTIRHRWAMSGTENIAHASDSADQALIEINRFFGESA